MNVLIVISPGALEIIGDTVPLAKGESAVTSSLAGAGDIRTEYCSKSRRYLSEQVREDTQGDGQHVHNL